VLHKSPKQLNASFLPLRVRPTPRILQFGGGNFMRAFFDMKVDLMNEAIDGDWGILIVRTMADGLDETLNDQEGLYTVIERRLDDAGRDVSRSRVVSSVRGEFFAQRDWDAIRALARRPEIRLVTSNTTDAGIALNEWDMYDDRPPKSFPAKLTRLLHERWKYLGRVRDVGWQIMPCELIENNGTILEQLVEQQARIWGLEPAFKDWLKSRNTFYNTVVDRIVPGSPHGEEKILADELGYIDRFMIVAENVHLLAIEKRKDQPGLIIPLAKHDPHTVTTDDIARYRSAKIRY
jgi:tagaturonate reductase